MILILWSSQKQVVAADVMVIPRSCSCSIQSIVAAAERRERVERVERVEREEKQQVCQSFFICGVSLQGEEKRSEAKR